MEQIHLVPASAEHTGELPMRQYAALPSMESAIHLADDSKKQFVAYDVDGTLFPDTTEFTGRMMNFLYDNDLLNESTACTVPSCGVEQRLTAKQAYENLYEQHADNRVSNNLETRKKFFLPLNIMHDRQIAGRKRSEVNLLADIVIKQALSEIYRPVAEEIDLYKSYGVSIGLISGSPDFLVQALKRALQLPIATGTQLRKAGDGRYHQTAPASPRGRDKHLIASSMRTRLSLEQLRRQGRPTTVECGNGLVRQLRLDEIHPSDRFEFTAMYGDTLYDLSAMEQAKDPVVVFDTKELVAPVKQQLYQHAIENGWRTIDVNSVSAIPYKFQHILQEAEAA